MEFKHKSVLLDETVQSLDVKPGGIYVDATLGAGGHSKYLLQNNPDIKALICFDRDMDAVNNFLNGKAYIYDKIKDCYAFSNIFIVHDNFKNIKARLSRLYLGNADGIMADLGVSSYQLDNPERGFSYSRDCPLDMRMDSSQKLTAKEVVNTFSCEKISSILRSYGQENWAAHIANVIVDRRRQRPINTTFELVDIIEKAVPKKLRDKNKHPAKRSFQALRIFVNDELTAVHDFLYDAFDELKIGGRLSIISFHSLEDKIVKAVFKDLSTGCTCPPDFPACVCGRSKSARLITRKPIVSSKEETAANPRARSARLRVIEKTSERGKEPFQKIRKEE